MMFIFGLPLMADGAVMTPKTCGELKKSYKDHHCCGDPNKAINIAAPCPYNFNKPKCKDAEPQSPRDLTMSGGNYPAGMMDPKAATLTAAQAAMLRQANVHYHLGAEHKSTAYSDGTDSAAYDAAHGGRRLASQPRPGFMCSQSGLSANQLVPHQFLYCKGDVAVGKTYEFHYVRSSSGYDPEDLGGDLDAQINDGLGGAANGRALLNPMVAVQAMVVQIVKTGGMSGLNVTDLIMQWAEPDSMTEKVMYAGSTTGPSHNNDDVCSPYAVSWHVDKRCHKMNADDFDMMCKKMKDIFGLENDLYPHGSRTILDPKWVVKKEYVLPLA